jgi:sensor histidine kinase YesM
VQWKLDPKCAHQTVPPGLLLTLVENAIEHGLEPKIGGGRIVVSTGCGATGNWWLRVEDDGIGLDSQAKDHVGLSNLRLRLQQHYGPRACFSLDPMESGGARAEIRMAEAA